MSVREAVGLQNFEGAGGQHDEAELCDVKFFNLFSWALYAYVNIGVYLQLSLMFSHVVW